jgi:hypothetical protein
MEGTNDQAKQTFDRNKLDYEQTTAYFRSLHETRFRLLQFLPLITGISIFTVGRIGSKFESILGLMGSVVVLGITLYDQRNNMIYDRLTKRAALLEKHLGFIALLDDKLFGGPFSSRPQRGKLLGFRLIWHDFALAIIYSCSFGVWIYMFLDGISHQSYWCQFWRIAPALAITIVYFSIYIHLVRRNDRDNQPIEDLINKASV